MTSLLTLKKHLAQAAEIPTEERMKFYKTGKGEYAEHDQFIGVNVPTLRKFAKAFSHLTRQEIAHLMTSSINEERLLALFLLIDQYRKADTPTKEEIYAFYMNHLKHVNNWNLVDASAHLIVGAHLQTSNRDILSTLARSPTLWERRIAIVATWYFIRYGDLVWTFKIAEILLKDKEDLIHKAVGWMLRESGKKDVEALISFLNQHVPHMPRTMLRYAIEKFPTHQRKVYLARPFHLSTEATEEEK